MLSYKPEKFASLYATDLGQRLWVYLTSRETIARLDTACQLSKPAVEGIEEDLLDQFKEEVLPDRVKQMVGHMVRQVLEAEGWVLDQSDVKVQSALFAKASRYRRPEWTTLHAFRNTADRGDIVISDRRQNPTLPADARWTYFATFASPLKAAVAFGLQDIKQVRKLVEDNGFHRIRVERMLRPAH